jgi:hypothetical protein
LNDDGGYKDEERLRANKKRGRAELRDHAAASQWAESNHRDDRVCTVYPFAVTTEGKCDTVKIKVLQFSYRYRRPDGLRLQTQGMNRLNIIDSDVENEINARPCIPIQFFLRDTSPCLRT